MPSGDGTAEGLEAALSSEVSSAETIAALREELAVTTDIRKQQEIIHKIMLEQAEAAGDIVEQMRLINVKEAAKSWDDIFASTTGISDAWKDSTAFKIWEGGSAGLQQSFARTFTSANIAVGAITKVAQASLVLAMEQDKVGAQFNKDTGAMRMYGDQMFELEGTLRGHGVNLEDAAGAYGALQAEMGQLNNMAKTEQVELAETAAVLEHMGVAAGTTAQNMHFLTAAMGMTAHEAAVSQREMFALAQEVGMAPEKMAGDFASAQPQMAKFGAEGTEVFKKLAVNAKHAGMEIDQLLSITEKFDTFAGAAESVGQLNAILGGPFLSSMQMVEATDPTERMRLLSGAVNEAGASFDDMGYYERIALTEAMGLKDVSELALVMRDGFDETVPAMASSQEELAALADQSSEYNSVQEEMGELLRMFAVDILGPFITALKFVLQTVQNVNQFFGGKLIPGLMILATVWFGFPAILGAAGAAFTAVGAAAAAGGTAAAAGLAAVVAPLTVAGPAAAAAAPGFIALAFGILLFGAAIALAATGLALLVSSFALLFASVDAEKLAAFTLSINGLIASLAMLTFVLPTLGLLAGGLVAFALALSFIDTTNIATLTMFFQSLSSVLDKDLEKLAKIEEAVKGISDAASAVDDTERLVAVRQIIEAVNGASSANTQSAVSARGGGTGAGALGQPLKVNMVMNGREMMSWSYNSVSDFLNYKS